MPTSIDTLPIDTLVQILCKLNHDELKPLFSISKSFHNAALIAQKMHFNFSTPQSKRSTLMAFARKYSGSPAIPALKVEQRKLRAFKFSEVEEKARRLAVTLFPVKDYCKP